MDRYISVREWMRSGDVCLNCGVKGGGPDDDPDIGVDTVEIHYKCENCGMRLEVSYTLDEVLVSQQPNIKQTGLAALCGILAVPFRGESTPEADFFTEKEWLAYFDSIQVNSMEALNRKVTEGIVIGSTFYKDIKPS